MIGRRKQAEGTFMKYALLLCALAFSPLTMAQELSTQESNKVIEEVISYLKAKDLSCFSRMTGHRKVSSKLNFNHFRNGSVTLNNDTQPAIIISNVNERDGFESYIEVTTNPDRTTIRKVFVLVYTLEYGTRNNGTIAHPNRQTGYWPTTMIKDTLCEY